MHSFTELIDRCAAFTIGALDETNSRIIEELQTSATTPLVKALQMIQLQKAVFAVGMFSIFDAILQDTLGADNGFKEASNILEREGHYELNDRLKNYQLAINVLKHGKGRSYESLVEKAGNLPFRVKLHGEKFVSEGDVSEVATLIEVDDSFVLSCAKVIRDVSEVINIAQ